MYNASEYYTDLRKAINDRIKYIEKLLDDHKREFINSGATDYGYAGDLAHVDLALGEVVTFLMGED